MRVFWHYRVLEMVTAFSRRRQDYRAYVQHRLTEDEKWAMQKAARERRENEPRNEKMRQQIADEATKNMKLDEDEPLARW